MSAPTTATVLAAGSLAVGAVGAVTQVMGAMRASANAGYNSNVAEINAEQAEAAAKSDANDIRRKGALENASLVSTAGAGGQHTHRQIGYSAACCASMSMKPPDWRRHSAA